MGKSCFHNFITDKIKERNDTFTNIIPRDKIRKILYDYHIPLFLHQRFLKEMEKSGLIKIINKQKVEILKKD